MPDVGKCTLKRLRIWTKTASTQLQRAIHTYSAQNYVKCCTLSWVNIVENSLVHVVFTGHLSCARDFELYLFGEYILTAQNIFTNDNILTSSPLK